MKLLLCKKKKNHATTTPESGCEGKRRSMRFWKKAERANPNSLHSKKGVASILDTSSNHEQLSSPADLPLELLANILSFVGEYNYIYTAGTCRTLKKALAVNTSDKKTNLSNVVSSISCTKLFINEVGAKNSDQILLLFKAAVENGQMNVIHFLDAKYEWEESVKLGDEGIELCRIAARNGNLEILKFLHTNGFSWDSRVASLAAEHGHLEILQFAHEKSCPWKPDVCFKASAAGYFEVLQYAYEHGCPWDARTCIAAAEAGHLDILKWAKSKGCPWDSFIAVRAAAGGHLYIVQWCLENGCDWSTTIASEAAAAGHLHILSWATEKHMLFAENDVLVCANAARCNQFEILKWARENNYDWNALTTTFAARSGNLEMLKWIVDNGCPMNIMTCIEACEMGHFSILKWAHVEKKMELDSRCCAAAALSGDIEILKYLRENDCKWDIRTTYNAKLKENYAILQYAIKNGCPC